MIEEGTEAFRKVLEKLFNLAMGVEYPVVYLDAHYEKVRVEGRVQDLAILKAIGVEASGQREVLGVSAPAERSGGPLESVSGGSGRAGAKGSEARRQ